MFWGAVKVCPWWLHYKTHTDAHTDLHTRTPLSVTHAFPQSTEYISMRLGVVCVGHNYNKWFFWEAAEQWRWGVNVRGRPLGQRWCLELENECGDWQADHMHAHTDTPRAQDWGFWSHRQLFFFFSPLSPILFSSLTHARTNKSVYLCADTKVTELDSSSGVHQHIGRLDICGDKLLHRTATSAHRGLSLSTLLFFNNTEAVHYLTHLCEVSSGSTDTSGLWLPRDTSGRELLSILTAWGV